MRVRVGICTRNRCEILKKSIDSVLAQDYSDIEVAVLNDASTDDTEAVRDSYPGIAWIREGARKGLIEGRSRLMSESRADIYITLDDDAWFIQGDEISRIVEIFKGNKSAAIVALDILSADHPIPRARGALTPINTFTGCGAALRLDAVRQVGFFPPVPGIYGSEEVDLSIRILDRGWDAVLAPGIHVWHDKADFQADLSWKHRSGVCNDLAFTLRRYPLPELLWRLPAKLLRHLLFSFKMHLFRPFLLGVQDFFLAIPKILKTRAPVRGSTLRTFLERGRACD